jgi:toxin FitB
MESPSCGGRVLRANSADLTAWLDALRHLYGDRVLAFDGAIARIAGAISDRARGLGHAPGLADIIVTATAQHHGPTILSRNLRHLEPLGVAVLDPFVKLPPK